MAVHESVHPVKSRATKPMAKAGYHKSTNGYQRDLAAAAGVSYTRDTTAQQLSALVKQSKTERKEPATKNQKRLAKKLGLGFSKDATREELMGRLWEFFLARSWVYSVCRDMTGSRWQFHADSGLPDKTILDFARLLLKQKRLLEQLREQTSRSGEAGDFWLQLPPQLRRSELYKFVEALVKRDLATDLNRLTEEQLKGSKPARRRKPASSRKGGRRWGWLLVVALLLLGGLVFVLMKVGVISLSVPQNTSPQSHVAWQPPPPQPGRPQPPDVTVGSITGWKLT